jgi:hypothetical protein
VDVAQRFYRHSIGYTPDQLRAERQIRLGRLSAIATVGFFVFYLNVLLLPLASVELTSADVNSLQLRWPVAVLIGLLVTAAVAAIVLAIARTKLPTAHPFHAAAIRWIWLLMPTFLIALWVGWEFGGTPVLLPSLVALTVWAAICEVWLRRFQQVGYQASPRVCVVDVVNRKTTWHTEAELAALDEAAQFLRGEIPDQSDRSYGELDGTT